MAGSCHNFGVASLSSTAISLSLVTTLVGSGPAEATPADAAPAEATSTEAAPEMSEPVPVEPQPDGQPPMQPQQAPEQAPHKGMSTNPVMLAKGIKETVMGSVFLGIGVPLIALGVPLILRGAENQRLNEDSSKGALQIAGGAVATGFGGMLTLFSLVLLPTGISKIVRSKRSGFAFNRTPRGTWTAGVHFSF